jgi:hypothetical protein
MHCLQYLSLLRAVGWNNGVKPIHSRDGGIINNYYYSVQLIKTSTSLNGQMGQFYTILAIKAYSVCHKPATRDI